MEDLASRALTWEAGSLRGNGFTLDFERDFGWIGVRYGFLMDRGLVLEGHEDYRAAWRTRFEEIGGLEVGAAQAAVDATEDALLVTLREQAEPFFVRALDVGALPQPLMERALRLLMEPAVTAVADPVEPPTESRLSQATAEKPLRQRILSHTIRHRDPPLHVRFAVTRRAHGSRK